MGLRAADNGTLRGHGWAAVLTWAMPPDLVRCARASRSGVKYPLKVASRAQKTPWPRG